jgi:tetratricopeptide (TPR) repeat protein
VFAHATRSFAATRPTIVLIDDLHFAPHEGRALFASLALAVPGHRILLVGTARPEIDAAWIAHVARGEHVSRLGLPRLGAKDLVLLLRDSLGSEHLAEELSAKIAVKSDGNPFFVFEILRGLREGQFLTRRPDGTWTTTKLIAEIEVPPTVKDLIFARVGSLSTAERNLLDVASCAGFDFDPVLVGEVLHIDRIPVLQRLAAVEKSHRLVHSAGRRFVFDHHQIAEVLYAGLPEMLREEYHAALGAALEARSGAASKEPKDLDGALCVDLAEHSLKGAKGERARRYFDAAFGHLANSNANDAAVRLVDQALAVPGLVAGRQRCELLLRKSIRLDFLGRRDAQRAAADEAIALADAEGDASLRARALYTLATLLVRHSRHDEARVVLGDALAMACASGDRRTEANVTGDLGIVFACLGRPGDAREHYERSLAIARQIGYRGCEAGAIVNLGLLHGSEGRYAEAQDHYERGIALCREIGHREFEANATGNLGNVLGRLGRIEAARELHERHLALAREIGSRQAETVATGNLGSVFHLLGRLGEARERYERFLALAREIGNRDGEALAMGSLGVVSWTLGRLEEAREHLERQLALAREIREHETEGAALVSLADVSSEEGDAPASERRLTEALELARASGRRADEATILGARGALLSGCGRTDEARTALAKARAIARELSLPGVELLATAELARLPGGDVAPALAALSAHEVHAAACEAMRARFLLWQANRDAAHLAEATRRLDSLVEHAPADCRESMLANVRLHREIAAAAREEGLPLAAESPRAGDQRSAPSAGA